MKSTWTQADYARVWVQEGGRRESAAMASAIGFAESKGNPHAEHRNRDGSVDRGPFQINSVHGSLSTFDQRANVRAAIQISKNGSDWSPWSTYKNQAYKPFMPHDERGFLAQVLDTSLDVADPWGLVPGHGGGVNLPNPLKWTEIIGDFFHRLSVLFERQFWIRVGMVWLGIMALALAVISVAKEYAPTAIAGSAAQKLYSH